MFVVERQYATAEIREQSEIESVLGELAAKGYQAALRSMLGAAAKAATVPTSRVGVDSLIVRDPRFRVPGTDAGVPVGDLLFTVNGGVADRCYFVQPFGERLYVFEIRHHCVPTGLPEFRHTLEHAIRNKLDGRRVRAMNFEWQIIKEPPTRLVSGASRLPVPELKTKKPEYSEEELRAARLLVGAESRSLLLQLAQIGRIKAADAKLSTVLMDQLFLERLLSKEYLVLCRKDSRTLCQVQSMKDLNEESGGKLVCPTCSRKFSEELVHEILAPTESGKRLVTSSRWMTIWITDLLVQAGLTKDVITWSATSGEDEIDIMTDELGLRILFELKDREFGLGDAYSFAYRVERYGGSLGVVVSTEKVAEEAHKFFQEQRSKAAASIETLEGSKIETGVRGLIDKYSRMGVQRTVTNLAGTMGVSVLPLLGSWMEMFAGAFRTGRYKPLVSEAVPKQVSQSAD